MHRNYQDVGKKMEIPLIPITQFSIFATEVPFSHSRSQLINLFIYYARVRGHGRPRCHRYRRSISVFHWSKCVAVHGLLGGPSSIRRSWTGRRKDA